MHQHRPESVILFFWYSPMTLPNQKIIQIDQWSCDFDSDSNNSKSKKKKSLRKSVTNCSFMGCLERIDGEKSGKPVIRSSQIIKNCKNKKQTNCGWVEFGWFGLAKCKKKMLWRVEDAWKSNNHQLHNIKHWDLNGNEFQFLSYNFQHERVKKAANSIHANSLS